MRIGTGSGIVNHIVTGIAHRISPAPLFAGPVDSGAVHGQTMKNIDVTRFKVPTDDVVLLSFCLNVRNRFVIRIAFIRVVPSRGSEGFGLVSMAGMMRPTDKLQGPVFGSHMIQRNPK